MSLHHRMMLQRYGLGHSTSLYSQVVFDPIFTPLFTAVLGTGGITIGASTITYASIASAIATTALSIGIQMLMAPKPPKPEAAKVPLAQSIPYRIWGVGRVRTAGAFMLYESSGPNLHAVQAQFGHRIKSFNRYWLHDDEVTLSSGVVVSPGGGRYGSGNVTIEHRLGLPTETPYTAAVAAFSGVGLWTNNHRGDGQASTFMVASATRQKDQNKVFPYGHPQLSVEADAAYCWDFRDPAQDPDDPGTWQWTRNSAVIIAWHLCFNEFGYRLDYQKALLPVIDLWKEEADICDEDVPLAGGGTEKRYQCNGVETTENGPKSGLNAMLSSCDGHLVARGDGARILTVGKFRESRCATLTDRDIVGHQIQYDVLFEDECNRLIPKFTYPATDYTTTDTDYFEDTAAQISAGRVLAQEAEYPWVHQWRQARRLGKRDWLRMQQKVKGSIDVRLSGINAVYARWVRLETPNRLPRLNGKLIENRRSILAITRGGFSMDIVQNPDDIDAWNPSTDEGAQPPVPSAPSAGSISTPVINLVQAKPNGESVYIRVVIIDPADGSLVPTVRYRLADAGSGNPGAWVEQQFPDAVASGGFVDLNTNVVPSNKLLDVQVAFITSGGAYGNWSTTANVTSTVDSVAPAAPVAFSANVSSLTVNLSATAANDNTRKLVFKRWASGGSFATGTVVGSYAVTANQVISFSDSPGYGHWFYGCGSENVSNIPSATQAGPVAADVLGPELITSGDMSVPGAWGLGTGWAISGGVATHSAGTLSELYQSISVVAGQSYELKLTVSGISGGTLTPRFLTGTTVTGTTISTNGTHTMVLTAAAGNNLIAFLAAAATVVTVDNVSLKRIA